MSANEFDIGPTPKFVEGGCLCGALRYRVDFPADHDFAASCMICQCTQCRKGTSSLFFLAHRLTSFAKSFAWTKEPTTLKSFRASPHAERAFCADCGSWMYWKLEGADRASFAVGTVDALYLAGEGADGVDVPEHGFGRALASGRGQAEFTANEIKGVTDDMPLLFRGQRFAGDSGE